MFNHDAHLRCEDEEVFCYQADARSRRQLAKKAADDVVRDLKAHGYLKDRDESFVDDFASATVTLTFVATDAGATITAGTPVGTLNPEDVRSVLGDAVFLTQSELVLAADESGTVEAIAIAPGEVFNVDAGELVCLHADVAGVLSVTNVDAATGGTDHQLTRAATYACMSRVYMDLMMKEDDNFDYKRKLYRQMYKEEIKRLVASGLEVDRDGDNDMDEHEEAHQHGFHRFERG